MRSRWALALLLLLADVCPGAVVAITGAETGDLTELSSASGTTVDGTTKNTGNYSYKLKATSPSAQLNLTAADEYFVSFYGQFNSSIGIIMEFRSGTTVLGTLETDGTTKLKVTAIGGTAATGSSTASPGFWHRLDFRFKKGTGSNAIAEVRLNGTVEATSSNGTSTAQIDNVRMRSPNITADWFFDDIRVDNAAYLADAVIQALRPNAVGDEDGATGTFADIDDAPVDDGTGRTESGSAPTAFVNNLTTITIGTIQALKIAVRASRSNGAARTHHIRADNGGTPENSADLVLDNTPTYYQFFPSTQLPTSQAELDAFQAGMDQDLTGGRIYTCTELWVMVAYTASGGVTVGGREGLLGQPITY